LEKIVGFSGSKRRGKQKDRDNLNEGLGQFPSLSGQQGGKESREKDTTQKAKNMEMGGGSVFHAIIKGTTTKKKKSTKGQEK